MKIISDLVEISLENKTKTPIVHFICSVSWFPVSTSLWHCIQSSFSTFFSLFRLKMQILCSNHNHCTVYTFFIKIASVCVLWPKLFHLLAYFLLKLYLSSLVENLILYPLLGKDYRNLGIEQWDFWVQMSLASELKARGLLGKTLKCGAGFIWSSRRVQTQRCRLR